MKISLQGMQFYGDPIYLLPALFIERYDVWAELHLEWFWFKVVVLFKNWGKPPWENK